jgi:hypothetical protein
MKYVLYIVYRSGRSSKSYVYRPLKAENLGDAIIEADSFYDPRDMYLVRIMEKDGALEHPERGVSVQRYKSRYEKRSFNWRVSDETVHDVKHIKTRYSAWFD